MDRVDTETQEGLTALVHVSTVGTAAQVKLVLDDEVDATRSSCSTARADAVPHVLSHRPPSTTRAKPGALR